MHNLMNYVCDELEEIDRKVERGTKISVQELEYADTLAHLKKTLMKIEEMSRGDGYETKASHSYNDHSEVYVRPDGSYSKKDGSVDEHTKEELRKLIEML